MYWDRISVVILLVSTKPIRFSQLRVSYFDNDTTIRVFPRNIVFIRKINCVILCSSISYYKQYF